ncbi:MULTISPECIES: hypothetical protein [Streptomyces]|uniref:hypothetical protein n=1 Tax=Streptomyces TaxID=1883 RepID=UPI0020485C99|nr:MULTISPECIES: hypothetical protein [Streptomyces]UPT46636.1 hypothetical protein MWG59_37810 [Streptomyces sp. WAC00303]WIY80756.1 hypothetical protein QPM16_37445 [Streptomyces anulatus]
MASSPSVEPLLKPFALALGEYLGDGPEVSGEAVEFGAVDRDCPESKVVDIREGLGRRWIQPATTRGESGRAAIGLDVMSGWVVGATCSGWA